MTNATVIKKSDKCHVLSVPAEELAGAYLWKCEVVIGELRFVGRLSKIRPDVIEVSIPEYVAGQLDLYPDVLKVQIRPLDSTFSIPDDLLKLCASRAIDIGRVPESTMRHMIGMLREASSKSIREARLLAVVSAIEESNQNGC